MNAQGVFSAWDHDPGFAALPAEEQLRKKSAHLSQVAQGWDQDPEFAELSYADRHHKVGSLFDQAFQGQGLEVLEERDRPVFRDVFLQDTVRFEEERGGTGQFFSRFQPGVYQGWQNFKGAWQTFPELSGLAAYANKRQAVDNNLDKLAAYNGGDAETKDAYKAQLRAEIEEAWKQGENGLPIITRELNKAGQHQANLMPLKDIFEPPKNPEYVLGLEASRIEKLGGIQKDVEQYYRDHPEFHLPPEYFKLSEEERSEKYPEYYYGDVVWQNSTNTAFSIVSFLGGTLLTKSPAAGALMAGAGMNPQFVHEIAAELDAMEKEEGVVVPPEIKAQLATMGSIPASMLESLGEVVGFGGQISRQMGKEALKKTVLDGFRKKLVSKVGQRVAGNAAAKTAGKVAAGTGRLAAGGYMEESSQQAVTNLAAQEAGSERGVLEGTHQAGKAGAVAETIWGGGPSAAMGAANMMRERQGRMDSLRQVQEGEVSQVDPAQVQEEVQQVDPRQKVQPDPKAQGQEMPGWVPDELMPDLLDQAADKATPAAASEKADMQAPEQLQSPAPEQVQADVEQLRVRANGTPFPTEKGATSQAGRLRKKGQQVQVVEHPQGGFGLKVAEAAVEPQKQEAQAKPKSSVAEVGLDQTMQDFIRGKVRELGSLEAVQKFYPATDNVGKFAREQAAEVYGQEGVQEVPSERPTDRNAPEKVPSANAFAWNKQAGNPNKPVAALPENFWTMPYDQVREQLLEEATPKKLAQQEQIGSNAFAREMKAYNMGVIQAIKEGRDVPVEVAEEYADVNELARGYVQKKKKKAPEETKVLGSYYATEDSRYQLEQVGGKYTLTQRDSETGEALGASEEFETGQQADAWAREQIKKSGHDLVGKQIQHAGKVGKVQSQGDKFVSVKWEHGGSGNVPLESAEKLVLKDGEKAEAQGEDAAGEIRPFKEQKKIHAKRMGKLLLDLEIGRSVLEDDFHVRVKNDPFLDLVIEGHNSLSDPGMREVLFTHYVEQNGDLMIDSEMVFLTHPNTGLLKLKETAVRGPAGEIRGRDEPFANIFTKNIVQQGFADGKLEYSGVDEKTEGAYTDEHYDNDTKAKPDEKARISTTSQGEGRHQEIEAAIRERFTGQDGIVAIEELEAERDVPFGGVWDELGLTTEEFDQSLDTLRAEVEALRAGLTPEQAQEIIEQGAYDGLTADDVDSPIIKHARGSLSGKSVTAEHGAEFTRDLSRKYGPGLFGGEHGLGIDELADWSEENGLLDQHKDIMGALLDGPGVVENRKKMRVKGRRETERKPVKPAKKANSKDMPTGSAEIFPAAENTQYEMFKNLSGGYSVSLRDNDSGEVVGSVRVFGVKDKKKAREWAKNQAELSLPVEDKPQEDWVAALGGDDYTPRPATYRAQDKIADWVAGMLGDGKVIKWGMLVKQSNKRFGGSQADGRYAAKDALDALELGVNRFLKKRKVNPGAATDAAAALDAVARIRDNVLKKIPTQTRRTEESIEMQQFSTPPHIAYLAAWLGKIEKQDVVIEPSAGTGSLAVMARGTGAQVKTNELDPGRALLLTELGFTPDLEDATQLHNIKGDIFSVVVMNPPFTSTSGRIKGQRKTTNVLPHLDSALKMLGPGGRLVAIVGEGMKPSRKNLAKWWTDSKKKYNFRASAVVSGKEYAKYGTTTDVRILVIDNNGPTVDNMVDATYNTVEEAITALAEIRNDRSEATSGEQARQEAPRAGRGGREQRDAGSARAHGLGVGERRGEARGELASDLRSDGRDQGSAGTARRESNAADRGDSGRGRERGRKRGTGRAESEAGSGHAHRGDRAKSRGPLAVTQKRTRATSKQELTDAVYDVYEPSVQVEGAKAHPGKLAESSALAAVKPAAVDYVPQLPLEAIEAGKISDAQLEMVIYAGHNHAQKLPDGKRKAFFIGDGTGVGKGREIASIIWDGWNRGRKKAVWISKNNDLFKDAGRDISGVGWEASKLFELRKAKAGARLDREQGVMFATYGTLRSEEKKKGGQRRIDQIVNWLGKDFDGVLAFDESHIIGNAMTTEGDRGKQAASQVATRARELRDLLPNARIVFVSATGAVKVSNLSYLERLGLWGEGTPFATVNQFVSDIASGGVAAMELVAADLKAQGLYGARNLSYDGVTYSRLIHELTGEQRDIHGVYAKAWRSVLQNMERALKDTGRENAKNKSSVYSAFWSGNQRFWNQVITSMQMPTAITDMEAELEAGRSVVVQLVNTNEAQLNRAMSRVDDETDIEDLDLTPTELIASFLESSFPVEQYEEVTDVNDPDKTIWSVARDSKGDPVINREAEAARDELLKQIGAIRGLDGPLDMLIDHFGTDKVAEVTGRSRRVVWKDEGAGNRRVAEKRTGKHSEADSDAFMAGSKRILVFSEAGGTGRSYHADLTAKNQQERTHYLVQPGWRAEVAVQGLGRTHRSNQAQPPHFKLCTTNIKAQSRFLSTIARRLDELGALTKGQRETGSQGIFQAKDNLENRHAADALRALVMRLASGDDVGGITLAEFQEQLGLKLVNEDGDFIETAMPTMPKFLNRLLSVDLEKADKFFDAFYGIMDRIVEGAAQRGELDLGMETLRAEKVKAKRNEVVRVDETSGAETRYYELELTHKRQLLTFEHVEKKASKYLVNRKSGKVWAVVSDVRHRNTVDGSQKKYHAIQGVRTRRDADVFDVENPGKQGSKFDLVDQAKAEKLWDKELAEMPKTSKETVHLVTGSLIPVWDRLKGKPKIVRARTEDGQSILGRDIPASEIGGVLESLGVKAGDIDLAEAVAQLVDDGAVVRMANGWRLTRKKVSGENRIELHGPQGGHLVQLERKGVFTESHGFRLHYFVPMDRAKEIIEKLVKTAPIVSVERSKKKAELRFARGEKPGRGLSVTNARKAVNRLQGKAKNALPLRVVAEVSELPGHVREEAERQGGLDDVQAVRDYKSDKVFLVAGNIDSRKRAVELWLHEQAGHVGLRGIFGPRELDRFLRQVAASAGKKGLKEIADLYGFDLSQQGDKLAAAEEYLARIAEKLRNDKALTESERSLWKRFVRWVRQALRNMGVALRFSKQELSRIMASAFQWVQEDAEGVGGFEGDLQPAFAREQPVVIVGRKVKKGVLSKEARRFAKEKLYGRPVRNRHSDVEISINSTGIAKVLGGGASKRQMVFHLRELLRESTYQWSEEARPGKDRGVKGFHRFAVKVEYEGKPVVAWLLVREDANGMFHYNHQLEIQKGDSPQTSGEGYVDKRLQSTRFVGESDSNIGTIDGDDKSSPRYSNKPKFARAISALGGVTASTGNELAEQLEGNRTYANQIHEAKDLAVHQVGVTAQELERQVQQLAGAKKDGLAARKMNMAMMVYRDMKINPDKAEAFREWARAELQVAKGDKKLRILEQMETLDLAENLTEEQQQFVDEQMEEAFAQVSALAEAHGVVSTFNDNYVRRIWDFPEGQKEDVGGAGARYGFQTFTTARMKRTLETIMDGWMAGYDLQVKGVTNSFEAIGSEVAAIVANKVFLKQGMEIGVLTTDSKVPGYAQLNASGFSAWTRKAGVKIRTEDARALLQVDSHGRKIFAAPPKRLWSVYHRAGDKRAVKLFDFERDARTFAAEQGHELVDFRQTSDIFEKVPLYAPAQIADMLNRMTKNGSFFDKPGLRHLLRFGAGIKGWILMSSFFHHLAGARSWYFGVDHGVARALKKADLVGAGKAIGEGLNSVSAYKRGLAKIEGQAPLLAMGIRKGLTLGAMQDWSESLMRSQRGAIESLVRKTGSPRADRMVQRAKLTRERFSNSLFKRYFAGLKAEAFCMEYAHRIQAEIDAGRQPDADLIAERTARLINEDFGGLHLKRMGRDPDTQNALRLLLLAPDWTESNFRTVSGMLPGLNDRISALMSEMPSPPGMEKVHRGFWGGILVKGVLTTLMAQLALNGWDDSEDFYKEQFATWDNFRRMKWTSVDVTGVYRALGVDVPEDRRKVFSLVGHFADPGKLLDPEKLIKGKGSPLVRLVAAAGTKSDWRDRPYSHWKDFFAGKGTTKKSRHQDKENFWAALPAMAWDQTLSMQPIQAGELLRYLQGEEDGLSALLKSGGAHVSTAYPQDALREEFLEKRKEVNSAAREYKELAPDARKVFREEKGGLLRMVAATRTINNLINKADDRIGRIRGLELSDEERRTRIQHQKEIIRKQRERFVKLYGQRVEGD